MTTTLNDSLFEDLLRGKAIYVILFDSFHAEKGDLMEVSDGLAKKKCKAEVLDIRCGTADEVCCSLTFEPDSNTLIEKVREWMERIDTLNSTEIVFLKLKRAVIN